MKLFKMRLNAFFIHSTTKNNVKKSKNIEFAKWRPTQKKVFPRINFKIAPYDRFIPFRSVVLTRSVYVWLCVCMYTPSDFSDLAKKAKKTEKSPQNVITNVTYVRKICPTTAECIESMPSTHARCTSPPANVQKNFARYELSRS